MIFERRAYTMEPGHVPAFDKAQTDRGFDLVKPYMERLVGYFSTASGPVDQVVHIYRYDSLDDWNVRLRGMYGVPELMPYFVNTRKIVRHQVNGFFEPLPVDALNPLWGGGRDWLPGSGAKLGLRSEETLIEERSFQLRPGGVPAFVEACAAHGEKALTRVMGDRMIGAVMAMIGPLHNVLLWWWFQSPVDREARVAELGQDRDWNDFLAQIAPAMTDQSTLLLTPRPVPEMSPLFL